MLDTFALVALERSLNTLLRRDPAASARLAALSDTTLRLTLDDARIGFRVAFHADGLILSRALEWHDTDDLEVTLTRHAMTRLMAGDSPERLLFSGQLPVTGQTALLPSIQTLFMDLDLDWEGALAKGLGSRNAHGVATGVHHLGRQARFMASEWQQDMREYLFEERRWLAGRNQLAVARDHLTELQQTVDRLGARIDRLQRRQEPHS
ncbi:ubiquinone biosynthesis accessory factor UbiJ [Salinicola halimionae]|uniref:ubiquinone biosynthesis accessory factor UbiJ n=1 Tax=Salinicola halimionae TaxID=1949081 RepID=UPI000DA14FCF|nr:SCP2 sterol-binding domain-containing protein [Salinicola halimionae]